MSGPYISLYSKCIIILLICINIKCDHWFWNAYCADNMAEIVTPACGAGEATGNTDMDKNGK